MLREILGMIRAPFLILGPVCLAPAFAIAAQGGVALDRGDVLLVVAAALSSHIAVNALNEYQDFRSGLDFYTKRTPFSGGSGTLVMNPGIAPVALYIALLALLATFSIGLYFFWRVGSQVMVPGLLGLAIIVGYTPWINRLPLLCLFSPGIGFGILMVNLAVWVLRGEVPVASWLASLMVAFLVSNLLLVNQLPDIEADRRDGRRHLAIAWGLQWTPRIYLFLTLGSAAAILVGVLTRTLPATALLAWLGLPASLWVAFQLWRRDLAQTENLPPIMAINLAATLATPLLLAGGLWLAG